MDLSYGHLIHKFYFEEKDRGWQKAHHKFLSDQRTFFKVLRPFYSLLSNPIQTKLH